MGWVVGMGGAGWGGVGCCFVQAVQANHIMYIPVHVLPVQLMDNTVLYRLCRLITAYIFLFMFYLFN
jgi:hypothetical protein